MPKRQEQPPRQMHLEEAAEDGYRRVYGSDAPSSPTLSATDQERALDALHQAAQKRRPKRPNVLTRQDEHEARKAWKRQLEAWGVPTDAERAEGWREAMDEAVAFIRAAGLGDLLEKDELTEADRRRLHAVLAQRQGVTRDLTSTEGVTIYPGSVDLAWDQTHHNP